MTPSTYTRLRQGAGALLRSRPLGLACTVLLALTWGMFCYAHLLGWQRTGDLSYLLFAGSESLMALLFALRIEAAAVSERPSDWLLGIAGTLAPLLFSPTEYGVLPAARVLIMAGVLVQIGGLVSLNRSLGVVAARRQIKTGGLYRVIRHPLYASYLLSYTGYVLVNSSVANLLLALAGAALLLARVVREERFLVRDLAYQAYMDQVKYRLIPLVY
jgi:protein-S-isoprenylcysteine O-methyltransferase Ste14